MTATVTVFPAARPTPPAPPPPPRRRRRKRRTVVAARKPRRDPTAAVMAMVDLRDTMRGITATKRELARQNAPVRRMLKRAIGIVVFGAIAVVLVAHAIAFSQA